MELLDFLKLVLPTKGHYCWVTIQNKRVVQGFLPTVEALSSKLLEENSKGKDTYFACSSFKEPGSRKSDNVLLTKSFWLDIDAGNGKPYKDAEEAASAVDVFCNKYGLPLPSIVCSGYGIHAWWPLDKELEPKEWKEYAGKLKQLSVSAGLYADPTRTSDCASILRPINTGNFKYSKEAPVTLWEFDGMEEQAVHSHEFLSVSKNPNGKPLLDIVKDWERIKEQQNDFSLEKGYPDGERTQALVARIGHYLGRACNYTETQCLEAMLQWNKINTPPLEEQKIRTTVASISLSEKKKRETLSGEMGELPKLPYGYKWDQRGRMVTSIPIKDTEDWEEVAVTEFPLYLEAVSKKEREFKQAYMFKQWLPKEGWREFQVNCKDFEGVSWKGFMAENGGTCILENKLFKSYVANADAEFRRTKMDVIRYQQFGWKENLGFLVGEVLIHNGGRVERVYAGEEIANRTKQMVPFRGGSLTAWSAEANLLFSDSYIHMGYALVSSFASTLLKFCMGESDGGFILSIMSRGSGKGKTRMIEAATSVWGRLESLQITPRDTINAQFGIVTIAGNLPVFMDEWSEKDPAILAKFIRQYTVGHDKNRAQRDGSVVSKPAEYKNLLITTSNHSIHDIMKQLDDEGAAARVLEVIAPDMAGDMFRRLDKITTSMLNNSGYAGREFIYQLLQPGVLEEVREQLTKATTHFRELLKTSGKDRYVAWLPAAVLVAGNLLNRTGILEFDLKRLMEWSIAQASQRIEEVVETTPNEILSKFITEHIGQCLMVEKPYKSGSRCVILNSSGYLPSKILMRSERDSKRLYVPGSTFTEWCMKNGYSAREISDSLIRDRILLSKRKLITLGAGTDIETGRVHCWELNMGHELITGEAS